MHVEVFWPVTSSAGNPGLSNCSEMRWYETRLPGEVFPKGDSIIMDRCSMSSGHVTCKKWHHEEYQVNCQLSHVHKFHYSRNGISENQYFGNIGYLFYIPGARVTLHAAFISTTIGWSKNIGYWLETTNVPSLLITFPPAEEVIYSVLSVCLCVWVSIYLGSANWIIGPTDLIFTLWKTLRWPSVNPVTNCSCVIMT